ncbi:unnamed protein product [Musa textilis]
MDWMKSQNISNRSYSTNSSHSEASCRSSHFHPALVWSGLASGEARCVFIIGEEELM